MDSKKIEPIRVETDRYTRPIVHRDERYCLQPKCKNNVMNLDDNVKLVENEYHFLMECSQLELLACKNAMLLSDSVLSFAMPFRPIVSLVT